MGLAFLSFYVSDHNKTLHLVIILWINNFQDLVLPDVYWFKLYAIEMHCFSRDLQKLFFWPMIYSPFIYFMVNSQGIMDCLFHSVKQIKARMYYGEYKAPTRWKPVFPQGITMTRTLRPVTFHGEPPRAPDQMPQPPWVEGANLAGAKAVQRRPMVLLRHPSARKNQRVSGYYATPMM